MSCSSSSSRSEGSVGRQANGQDVNDVIGALRGKWLIYDANRDWERLKVQRPTFDSIGRAQTSRETFSGIHSRHPQAQPAGRGVTSAARDDPGEEYVARTVLRLWRCHGEDRREPVPADGSEALGLTETTVGRGAEIERPSDVRMPPCPALVTGGGEPDVGRRLGVTESVAAVVVPEDAE